MKKEMKTQEKYHIELIILQKIKVVWEVSGWYLWLGD
jgi:hypothetical protein